MLQDQEGLFIKRFLLLIAIIIVLITSLNVSCANEENSGNNTNQSSIYSNYILDNQSYNLNNGTFNDSTSNDDINLNSTSSNPQVTIAGLDNTQTFTLNQITDTASRVRYHIENYNNLPSYVDISGTNITISQFLELLTTALLKINQGTNDTLYLSSFIGSNASRDNIHAGNIQKSEYLKIASDIKSYMDSTGKTPDYAYGTSLGSYLGFENMVYMYSMILDYYNSTVKIAGWAEMVPWSVIISKPFVDPNSPKFSIDQIEEAAVMVRNHIEIEGDFPENITISGVEVTLSQLLELFSTVLLQINSGNKNSIVLRNFIAPLNPIDNINAGNIQRAEFLKLAGDIKNYMDSTGKTPDYAYKTSLGSYLGFENMVYMYAMILDYHNSSGKIADWATMRPWSVITRPVLAYFSVDQIKVAASTVRRYVESNHQLPSIITIDDLGMDMSQFLELFTTATLQINNRNFNPIPLRTFVIPVNPMDNIHSGNIQKAEYLKLAGDIKNFMDSTGKTPDYAYRTSLGTYLGFQNLVYMYAMILDYYNTSGNMAVYAVMSPWSKCGYSITDEIVSAEARCSCSLYTDYNIHTGTYLNYCPYCHKFGTLTYTNQQGCPEGMFYCDMAKGGCDADFCIVHGKAHTNINPKFLTPV